MITPHLQHRVNLLSDGTVVTDEGEYLGTWDTDETDAFFRFFPDGSTEPLLIHPFKPGLVRMIEDWQAEKPDE